MKKQLKRWMIFLGVLVAVILLMILVWPALKIYLAPKAVLTAALTDTYAELEHRFENSPVLLIGRTLDLENGNTIDMELAANNGLLGAVDYDMSVQVQWNPRRILAKGQASAQSRNLDLSVYMDGNFAALSSAGILQGNYYGLTYDTFEADIRSNNLLSFVIGEDMLEAWSLQVQNLQTVMNDAWDLPSISREEIKSILTGILTLKAEVERVDMDVNGREEVCHVISFETTGAQIQSGLSYLDIELPVSLNTDDEVEISFWLQDDRLIKLEAETEVQKLDLFGGITSLGDPDSDDLILIYQNAGQTLTVTLQTRNDAGVYSETVTFSGSKKLTVSYNWDLSTGNLVLDVTQDGVTSNLTLKLTAAENGFRLATEDIEALLQLLLGTANNSDTPCTMVVSKGTDFETPEYKNFSNWSLEDLVTLLSGVGSLFGLKIA